ncbi:UNVERIFIED_CONTAM: hypothetical protein Slati_1767200 [Sesamum latifolium]|uniref:Uncharacterized protein n=1 Tax=Sesamum latifolium TaxID=2727402 RepID=A0AAW2WY78_9LAMI
MLSRPSGEPAQAQGEASKKKLEDRVVHLLGEVAKLKDSRKEAAGRCEQAEKEVKKLQREVKALKEDHEEELRTLADQVRKEFPDTKEGKNLLETCWNSRWPSIRSMRPIKRK